MKRIVLLAFLTAVGLAAHVANAAPMGHLDIYGAVGVGPLLSGDQKDIPDLLLAPKPDSYSSVMGVIGARIFPVEEVGVEAFATFGSVSAGATGYQSMTLYDYAIYNGGLILRGNILLGGSQVLSFHLGGGVSYGGASIDKDFNSWAIANLAASFLPTSAGVGWYGKVGLAYHFDRMWFVDLSGVFFATKTTFSSGATLDGNLLLITAGIGVSLF